MPIEIDIRKTPFYKLGKEEGLKEGEQRGLKQGLKEGEQKGLKEGLKEAILMDVQLKFGILKAKELKNLLDKIDDLRLLKKIKREVIKTRSWNDFTRVFKNSNPK